MNKKIFIFLLLIETLSAERITLKPLASTGSMLPTYKAGEVMQIDKGGYQNIKEETVVVRKLNNKYVFHRAKFYVKKYGWKTAGDNCFKADGQIQYDLGYLNENNLIGIVVEQRPNINRITKKRQDGTKN